MIAIPAIDIINGSCVRLLKGQFDQQQQYTHSPLQMAKALEVTGLTHLHLVDLDGARDGKPANLPILQQLATHTKLLIDYGGGIRRQEDVAKALDSGATRVNIGTMLFTRPSWQTECIRRFGADKLIASVDVDRGKVAIKGWQQQTGLTANQAIGGLRQRGWRYVSITDIGRDGTMSGVDPSFYQPFTAHYPEIRFIGGGGVASLRDLHGMKGAGLFAAITGKAVFEGNISLEDLASFNKEDQ